MVAPGRDVLRPNAGQCLGLVGRYAGEGEELPHVALVVATGVAGGGFGHPRPAGFGDLLAHGRDGGHGRLCLVCGWLDRDREKLLHSLTESR